MGLEPGNLILISLNDLCDKIKQKILSADNRNTGIIESIDYNTNLVDVKINRPTTTLPIIVEVPLDNIIPI